MLPVKVSLILTLSAIDFALGVRVTLPDSAWQTKKFATCKDCVSSVVGKKAEEKGLWCVYGKGADQMRMCIAPKAKVVDLENRNLCSKKNAKPTCDYPEGAVELTRKLPDYSHMLRTCTACVQERVDGYAATKWFVGIKEGRHHAVCAMEGYQIEASFWREERRAKSTLDGCDDYFTEDDRSQLPEPCTLTTCDSCLKASRHLNYGWCTTKNVCVRRHAVDVAGCKGPAIVHKACPGEKKIPPPAFGVANFNLAI